MHDRVNISELKNKIFSKVYRNGDRIIFENSKEKYELLHDQNCCEDVFIDDVCGELSNLENAEITYAERTTNEGNPKVEYDGSCTWTFFKFATNKGWVDVRFYGTSNGYYSEDADLYLVEKKDEISDYSDYESEDNHMMKLFEIILDSADYDDYDSCVLAAENLEQVKEFCDKNFEYQDEFGLFRNCCKGQPFQIHNGQKVEEINEIGSTDKYSEPTIICSSFNAG